MQTNKLFFPVALGIAVLVAACGSGGDDEEEGPGFDPSLPTTTTKYTVVFSAEQVVSGTPAPAGVTATANLQTQSGNDFTASGTITISGASASSVNIHAGFVGESGPAIFSLTGSGSNWSIPAGTEIDPDERNLLEAANLYVLVETPQGRLRAQILSPGWDFAIVDLAADGTVPASGSSATAKSGFMYNTLSSDYRVRIATTGLGDAMSASIRSAIAGTRGEVFAALELSAGTSGLWGSADINDPNFGPRLNNSGLTLLDQGALYLSVETPAAPEGAVRGQILLDSITVATTELSDAEVVSSVTVDSNASATATLTYNTDTSTFGMGLSTSLDNAISVSVHQAPVGENGTFLYSLTPDTGLPGNWALDPTVLSESAASALVADELYVLVTTPDFPEGELRAQLSLTPVDDLGKVTAVIDPSSTQSQPMDAFGGDLSMTTAQGAQVVATIPRFAVAESTAFSITDITSVEGLPANARMLAAVQMGPAEVSFAHPVVMSFDVTGMRTPGTILVAFKTSNSGENLRLIPLRDSTEVLGFASTALEGTQVSVGVQSFSNIGLMEFVEEEAPGLMRQLIRQRENFEFTDEFIERLMSVLLDKNISRIDKDDRTLKRLAELIRDRRSEISEWMEEFKNRPELTADNFVEYGEYLFATILINEMDDSFNPNRIATSRAEIDAAHQEILELGEVYGAGLHLQCFKDPESVEGILGVVALGYALRVADEVLKQNPEIGFDEIFRVAEELSECFSPRILRAFFESFDVESGDEIKGTATDLLRAVTDNVNSTYEGFPMSDMPTELIFIEPQLQSLDPLTIGFKEVTERLNGLFVDHTRIIIEGFDENETRGTLELSEETSFPVASSQEQIDDGERPVVTHQVSSILSGPIGITPTSLAIQYGFDTTETSDGILVNQTVTNTGQALLIKEFTPRSFAAEIELYD